MNERQTTLNIQEVADLLKCNKETVRRLAVANRIPAAKIGRKWIFIWADIENFIRTQYSNQESVVQVVDSDEESLCQFTNEIPSGGLSSLHQTEKEYNALLGLKTENQQKSTKQS